MLLNLVQPGEDVDWGGRRRAECVLFAQCSAEALDCASDTRRGG
jgi:hypothetical protein